MSNNKELNDFIEEAIGFDAFRYSRTIYMVKMLHYVRKYFRQKNIDIPIKRGRLSQFSMAQFEIRFHEKDVDLYDRNAILTESFDIFKHVKEDGNEFIKTIEFEFNKGLEPYKKIERNKQP